MYFCRLCTFRNIRSTSDLAEAKSGDDIGAEAALEVAAEAVAPSRWKAPPRWKAPSKVEGAKAPPRWRKSAPMSRPQPHKQKNPAGGGAQTFASPACFILVIPVFEKVSKYLLAGYHDR